MRLSPIPDEDLDDPRLFVPNIEFYINNVCNLTCSNCNRFNNHEFRGWQNWADYAHVYEQWAQHIRLQRITIMGGEPLLNPSVCDWINGINRIWKKPVQILTNGTRLNHVPGLYEQLTHWSDPKYHWIKNWIGVSLHNSNDREKCFENIKKFLKGPVDYISMDDPRNKDNAHTMGAQHAFVDSNGVRICVWEYDEFYTAAVQRTQAGRFTLFNNDPEESHSRCGFAQYKCHHFAHGKIYKCAPVALFPEFDQQHTIDLTDDDRRLLNEYRPLTAEEFPIRGKEFFDNIGRTIPQCKFCPTEKQKTMTKLLAVTKKQNSISSYD